MVSGIGEGEGDDASLFFGVVRDPSPPLRSFTSCLDVIDDNDEHPLFERSVALFAQYKTFSA